MENPSVSIITANFNKGTFVVETIQSVLAQSAKNWELVFVDDHSTDNSFELAKKAASGDERCRFFTNNTGVKGANSSRNQGIEAAKGNWIMFLDSDDLLSPVCIENRLADIKQYPEMDVLIYPTGIFFDEVGDSELICNIPTSKNNLHRFLERDITWLISGPIWRKSALKSLGGFDLSLHSQQDYDLHVRALIKALPYKYFHKEPDVYYRRNVDSLPRKTSQSLEHFRGRFKMVKRHVEMLEKEAILGATEKCLLAKYILDLAQMMRWHQASMGKAALKEGLAMWKEALEMGLVDKNNHRIGERYIKFKHQMIYNRFPRYQAKLEKKYRALLGNFIFEPSKTYCRVTLADYEE